tara:strand:- start:2152 stop:2802 length:651 start_codon:yes stop_codon:yes gene_type:complete
MMQDKKATKEHPIFKESIHFIQERLGKINMDPLEREVLHRVIHSSGDFAIQKLLRFSPKACDLGIEALKKRASIVTDTKMAAVGITSMARRTSGSEVYCCLDYSVNNYDMHQTKTALGMDRLWKTLCEKNCSQWSPIVLIGSSPTALIVLLDLVKQGICVAPSLIIGMPVGFIGVQESKKRLLESHLPYIVIEGSRGGAGLAAAATNALLKMSIEE